MFYWFDCFFNYVICIIYNIVVGKVYDIRKDCFKKIRKLYWNFKFNIINFNEVILVVMKFIFCNIYIYKYIEILIRKGIMKVFELYYIVFVNV